jgi:hypothetical protein
MVVRIHERRAKTRKKEDQIREEKITNKNRRKYKRDIKKERHEKQKRRETWKYIKMSEGKGKGSPYNRPIRPRG